MSTVPQDKITLIEPNRQWWKLPWKEFWQYRDLLVLLVRRDFVARYKQSILGPLWFILQPLLMMLVFTVIFGRLAQLPSDGVPHSLFYLAGLTGWNFFALALTSTAATFTGNTHLFQKVYFPRMVVPVAGTVSAIFSFAVQLVLFLMVFVIIAVSASGSVDYGPNLKLLWLPLVVAQTLALALGVGLWFASITAKYRDLTHLMQLIVQLWLYLSVILPQSSLEGRFGMLVYINPMTPVIENYRLMLLNTGEYSLSASLCSLAITLTALLSGILVFQRTERTFADTV